jgi:hypothetical protein
MLILNKDNKAQTCVPLFRRKALLALKEGKDLPTQDVILVILLLKETM